jgi:hypothetical protein
VSASLRAGWCPLYGDPSAFTCRWAATAAPSDGRILVHCVQEYCYCRERKYCPSDDMNDFGYVVKVKENAPDLLRRALSRLPVDLVMTGDYQAAERRFGPSRRILEVCLELGLPVAVLERSPGAGRPGSARGRQQAGRSISAWSRHWPAPAHGTAWSRAMR